MKPPGVFPAGVVCEHRPCPGELPVAALQASVQLPAGKGSWQREQGKF